VPAWSRIDVEGAEVLDTPHVIKEVTMHTRLVTCTLKTERWNDIRSAVAGVVEQIEAIPGLRTWVLAADPETGTGFSTAVFESTAAFEAAEPRMNELLSGFGPYFEGPPSAETKELLAHVSNR
jgi:hypothetical protein